VQSFAKALAITSFFSLHIALLFNLPHLFSSFLLDIESPKQVISFPCLLLIQSSSPFSESINTIIYFSEITD